MIASGSNRGVLEVLKEYILLKMLGSVTHVVVIYCIHYAHAEQMSVGVLDTVEPSKRSCII